MNSPNDRVSPPGRSVLPLVRRDVTIRELIIQLAEIEDARRYARTNPGHLSQEPTLDQRERDVVAALHHVRADKRLITVPHAPRPGGHGKP